MRSNNESMNVASGVSDMTSGGALGVGGYGSGGLTVTFCVGWGYGKVAILTALPCSTPKSRKPGGLQPTSQTPEVATVGTAIKLPSGEGT